MCACVCVCVDGGVVYSYIHVLSDEFFQTDQFEFDLKRNSSGRRQVYMNIQKAKI